MKPKDDAEAIAVSEVRDETGIECNIVRKISERKHPDSGVYVHYFHADWVTGEPVNVDPDENDEVEWVSPTTALERFRTDVDEAVRSLLQTVEESKVDL